MKGVKDKDGELYGYEFMELDVEPMAKDELEKHPDSGDATCLKKE